MRPAAGMKNAKLFYHPGLSAFGQSFEKIIVFISHQFIPKSSDFLKSIPPYHLKFPGSSCLFSKLLSENMRRVGNPGKYYVHGKVSASFQTLMEQVSPRSSLLSLKT